MLLKITFKNNKCTSTLVHTNHHNSHSLSKVINCQHVLICRLKSFQIWECHFCLFHTSMQNKKQTFLDIKKNDWQNFRTSYWLKSGKKSGEIACTWTKLLLKHNTYFLIYILLNNDIIMIILTTGIRSWNIKVMR